MRVAFVAACFLGALPPVDFQGSLLCTSHGIETSLLTPLLLRLELGELEAALALESDGGAAAATYLNFKK